MSNELVWSKDCEYFNSDSLHEIIRDHDLKAGDQCYFGTKDAPAASSFIDVDDIIEDAQNRAMDNYGEFAESFLDDVTDEAKKELGDFLSVWMDKNAAVRFYLAHDITEYIVTEDDVRAAHA